MAGAALAVREAGANTTVEKQDKRMKTLRRLLQIAWAIGGHFLWWGLVRLHLLRPVQTPARRLAAVLEGLGTTFIKLGQGLSLRRDILPDDYVEALQSLQDRVRPFPTEAARHEIESALGNRIEVLFREFEDEPMAAASIAQVHGAVLPDGRKVIVKVRRPRLREEVLRDTRLLRWVLQVLVLLVPRLHQYDLLEIVRESGLNLLKELDFRQEMRHILRFQAAFKGSATIHIPAAVPELCTESVLVQERSGGRLVTDPAVRSQGPELAVNFFDAYLHQLFVMGLIHGDPHPGNLFIMDDGKICFHDFGLVGYIDKATRRSLAAYFLALINQDGEWLLDAYLDLGMLSEEVDRRQAQRGLEELMQEYATLPLKEWSLATAMLAAVRMGWGYQLRLPYNLLILMRALFLIDATLRTLDPEFNVIAYLQERGATLMRTALKEGSESSLARMKYEALVLGQELPGAVARLLRGVREHGPEIPLRHHGLRDFEQHMDRSSNRIALALVALGLYIAASLLAQGDIPPLLGGMPLVAVIGYGLALWVTYRLLRGISRSGRL